MSKFRKKPVVIEAMQLPGSFDKEWCKAFDAWLKGRKKGKCCRFVGDKMLIPTLEGTMDASAGDWIIQGVKGEIYPCKPDIFAATYEPVEEPANEPD